VVASVEKSSPAEKAGLKPGDLIVAIDGKPVADSNDLRNRIGLREVGATVEITYFRKGETRTVKVQVDEPQQITLAGESAIAQLAGATLTDIPADHPASRRLEGALVSEVETASSAWRVGLRSGDIIVAMNQQKVGSAADLQRAVKGNPGVLALNVVRGDRQVFIIARG
jgi:serine protease Do/serine protease DegQ